MSPERDDEAKLIRRESEQAIRLALEGRWREAIAVNQSILESLPDDLDSYNRLGRAYMELGDYEEARRAYRRALELDPYNPIARRNLHRLEAIPPSLSVAGSPTRVEPHEFIEETGKAGQVQLVDLAPRVVPARLVAGDKVELNIENGQLIARNSRGEYLGRVEPRHAARLVRLMRGGNRYSAVVVNSTDTSVTLMVREVYQDPSLRGILSFPSRGIEDYRSYVEVPRLEKEEEEEGEVAVEAEEEALEAPPIIDEEPDDFTEDEEEED